MFVGVSIVVAAVILIWPLHLIAESLSDVVRLLDEQARAGDSPRPMRWHDR